MSDPPASIGDPACIRDPASIGTNEVWPPACIRDPACIWDPASIRGNTVFQHQMREMAPDSMKKIKPLTNFSPAIFCIYCETTTLPLRYLKAHLSQDLINNFLSHNTWFYSGTVSATTICHSRRCWHKVGGWPKVNNASSLRMPVVDEKRMKPVADSINQSKKFLNAPSNKNHIRIH